jgi:hypothetical protein
LVEFALVIAFVFLVFVAMLQMILLMSAYNTLADAAKEGVRYAIVHGTGNSNCSGPGDPTSNPTITCGDPTGSINVKPVVTNFAGLSFQNVTNVTIDYDPSGANTASPRYNAPCSAPGCMVRITVNHVYTPLFGFGWPSVTINAAASGRIMN